MKKLLLCLSLLVLMVGCTGEVPAGFKGRVQGPSGWNDDILSPGRHTCYGRDVLWMVETRDLTKKAKLDILLQKDKVNFGVEIALTFTLSNEDNEIRPLFDKVRPSQGTNNISLEGVYNTYAAPVMESVPKNVVRPYSIEQILESSGDVEKQIATRVIEALKGSPIKVKRVAVTNMDFPDFITQAQERAKNAEVKIKEEQHEMKRRLLAEENKKRIAEIQYQREILEGKTIRDKNKLIGESLIGNTGEAFLRWHQIRVYGSAAEGPNNCLFLPMDLMNSNAGAELASMQVITEAIESLKKELKQEK